MIREKEKKSLQSAWRVGRRMRCGALVERQINVSFQKQLQQHAFSITPEGNCFGRIASVLSMIFAVQPWPRQTDDVVCDDKYGRELDPES